MYIQKYYSPLEDWKIFCANYAIEMYSWTFLSTRLLVIESETHHQRKRRKKKIGKKDLARVLTKLLNNNDNDSFTGRQGREATPNWSPSHCCSQLFDQKYFQVLWRCAGTCSASWDGVEIRIDKVINLPIQSPVLARIISYVKDGSLDFELDLVA